jgi:hypothetical protein
MIPFAISRNLTTESWSVEWELAVRMYRGDPVFGAALWGIYGLGYICAWVLVVRSGRRPV